MPLLASACAKECHDISYYFPELCVVLLRRRLSLAAEITELAAIFRTLRKRIFTY